MWSSRIVVLIFFFVFMASALAEETSPIPAVTGPTVGGLLKPPPKELPKELPKEEKENAPSPPIRPVQVIEEIKNIPVMDNRILLISYIGAFGTEGKPLLAELRYQNALYLAASGTPLFGGWVVDQVREAYVRILNQEDGRLLTIGLTSEGAPALPEKNLNIIRHPNLDSKAK